MTSSHTFPIEKSSVDIRSPGLAEARSKWEGILHDFQERLKEVSSEGSAASCSRHQHRGQLLRAYPHVPFFASLYLFPPDRKANAAGPFSARDRIALLLDFDSPFLELCPFAGHRLPNSNNCANIVAGIGVVRLAQFSSSLAPEVEDVYSED